MIVEKKVSEDYESFMYQYLVTSEFGFERDVIERHLSAAQQECKDILKKLTKGE